MTRWTEVFPDLGASIRFWAETNQVSKECWPLRARHHLWHCYPLVALGKTRSGSRKVTRHSNVGVEKVIEPARRKTVASAVPAAIPAAPQLRSFSRDEFVQDDEEETAPVKKSAPVNDSTLARGSRRVSPRHFIKAKLAAIAKKNVLRITDSRVADIVAESNRNFIHLADTAMHHLLMLHHHAKAINNTELTTRADDFSQSGASDFSQSQRLQPEPATSARASDFSQSQRLQPYRTSRLRIVAQLSSRHSAGRTSKGPVCSCSRPVRSTSMCLVGWPSPTTAAPTRPLLGRMGFGIGHWSRLKKRSE
ncbi:unnamed protein product [Zymoseptoria tritici ST99CH_1A5]|uniref:Uncharacterized protein n=1 Tax=Zymoseptoria tritici ST99CH_1A5 TaxID=1276529 RepID=A0A1Y6M1D0_ZYMTR|nr:unnamed protein product [Zymoseptoria tritici ST99CH_1A5]